MGLSATKGRLVRTSWVPSTFRNMANRDLLNPTLPPRGLLFRIERSNPRAMYWAWVNSGGRLPRRPGFAPPVLLQTGQRLQATDRVYEVQSNGSWRRISAKGLKLRPFKESNLATREFDVARPHESN